jgi:hypothetical protein
MRPSGDSLPGRIHSADIILNMNDLGRILIFAGIGLLVIGGLVTLLPRLGIQLGRLPGDIRYESDQLTCLVPIATSILLSILLTVGLNLFARFFDR